LKNFSTRRWNVSEVNFVTNRIAKRFESWEEARNHALKNAEEADRFG